MEFLRKKEQEENKLALISCEHHLVFVYPHNGSRWCFKCQELFSVPFWPISLTWVLNMAIKETPIPPSTGKPNKMKHLPHICSWLWIMSIGVSYNEEWKKVPWKGRGGDHQLQSTGCVSLSTPLPHNVAEKLSSFLTPFPLKHRWRQHTVFEKTAPKELNHRTPHGLRFSKPKGRHGSPTWLAFFFLISQICIHECAHAPVLLRLFNSHFSSCLSTFLQFVFH